MRVAVEPMGGKAALYSSGDPTPFARVRPENVRVTLDGEESLCVEADDEDGYVLALDVIARRGPAFEFAVDEFGKPKYRRQTGRVRIEVKDHA